MHVDLVKCTPSPSKDVLPWVLIISWRWDLHQAFDILWWRLRSLISQNYILSFYPHSPPFSRRITCRTRLATHSGFFSCTTHVAFASLVSGLQSPMPELLESPWASPEVPQLPRKFPGLPRRSAPFSGKPDTLSWLTKTFSEKNQFGVLPAGHLNLPPKTTWFLLCFGTSGLQLE